MALTLTGLSCILSRKYSISVIECTKILIWVKLKPLDSNASLPVPKQQKSSTIAEQRDDLTTSTPVADVQTVGSLEVLENVKSTLLEDPTRITPVANRLQMIDIETDVLDGEFII